MTREEFSSLKVGDKIRKPGNTFAAVYTVVNNDPPGNILILPGRVTKIATRPVHPETWEFDSDQSEENPLKAYREQSNKTVRVMGFLPSEEQYEEHEVDDPPRFQSKVYVKKGECLQALWREAGCRRDPKEILAAVIDGLTQEGVSAWPGDATSIVEQMIRTQYDRAEEALREVERLRKIIADSWGESGDTA